MAFSRKRRDAAGCADTVLSALRLGRLASCVGERPLPCAAVSAIAYTGHSDDSHSPDAWASVVVRRIRDDDGREHDGGGEVSCSSWNCN